MRQFLIGTLGILTIGVIAYALVTHDWKPSPPSGDYGQCLAGHEETTYITTYQSMCSGNSCTSYPMIYPVSSYVCTQHQYPNGAGPRWVEGMKQYHKDLAAWRLRNPGKD